MQLYHATSREIEGEYLIPQTRENIAMATDDLVFASPKILATYGYALKSANPDACQWQTHWEINDLYYVVLKNRERLPTHPIGKIYPVDGEFKNVAIWDGSSSYEWTSSSKVKVDQQNAIAPKSVDEIMARGVQVFFLADKISQQEWHQVLKDIGKGSKQVIDFHGVKLEPRPPVKTSAEYNQRYLELTRELTQCGLMIHENAERAISPANLYTGNIADLPYRNDWAKNLLEQSQKSKQSAITH